MSDALKPVMTQHVDAAFELTIAALSQLARIPSVSWPGFDPAHVQASAENPARWANQRLRELRDAGTVVFAARASEATSLGLPSRDWPPTLTAFDHWRGDYADEAASAGAETTLEEAASVVNQWIAQIDAAEDVDGSG